MLEVLYNWFHYPEFMLGSSAFFLLVLVLANLGSIGSWLKGLFKK